MGNVTDVDQKVSDSLPASSEVQRQEVFDDIAEQLKQEPWQVPELTQQERAERQKTRELVENEVVALAGTLAIPKEPERAPTPIESSPKVTVD